MVDRAGLAAAFREAVVSPRRRACAVLLERAFVDGELHADMDRELTIDMPIGPIMFRRLVSGAPLSSTLARDVVDLVWKAFTVR